MEDEMRRETHERICRGYTSEIAALRSRVEEFQAEVERLREALERKCIKEYHSGYWCEECEVESEALPFPHAEGCICAALQPDKGERLSQQERDTLAEARAIVESAQATREEMDRKYDDKGEDCATCYGGGLVNQIDPHHPPVACPACDGTGRQQPDKGERCGGRGWFPLPRQERTPTGRNSRDCPGCPDCSEAP